MKKETITIKNEDIKIRKIQPPISKIIKDKTKYSRKNKHKNKCPEGGIFFNFKDCQKLY